MNIQTVLVPCDFSRCSETGLQLGRDLARKFDARVVIAHVSPSPQHLVVYGPAPARLPADLDEEVDASVQRGFEAMSKHFAASDEVANVHLRGDPGTEILRYAADENVDLIVMSTHGHSGLKQLVMGSVAERILRSADCPVITVKPTGPGDGDAKE